jgi:putative endonuclease
MADEHTLGHRLQKWWQSEPWREWVMVWRAWTDAVHEPVLLNRPLDNAALGKLGEHYAAQWLRRHQRRVLYRNYLGQHRGEVDLVCRHGRVLTFVEVKTRSGRVKGRPADAVNAEKRHLIQRGAQDWLRRLGHPPITIRFDIAEVILEVGKPPQVNVIENAFSLPDGSMEGRIWRD